MCVYEKFLFNDYNSKLSLINRTQGMSNLQLNAVASKLKKLVLDVDLPVQSPTKTIEDFTWGGMDDSWRAQLLSDSFVVKDCIGDGNCQFRSIETALTNAGYKTNHEKLRKVVGKYIRGTPDHEFQEILESYKLEKTHGDFRGEWNPFLVKSRRAFIKNITTPGTHFEGDFITLSLLSKAIGIDFLIFDESNHNIIDMSNPKNTKEKIIILHYEDHENNSGHYNSIGYRTPSGRIISLFKRHSLPADVATILNKREFILEHIKQIYEGSGSRLTFNELVVELEQRMRKTFTQRDKQKIADILKKWILEKD